MVWQLLGKINNVTPTIQYLQNVNSANACQRIRKGTRHCLIACLLGPQRALILITPYRVPDSCFQLAARSQLETGLYDDVYRRRTRLPP